MHLEFFSKSIKISNNNVIWIPQRLFVCKLFPTIQILYRVAKKLQIFLIKQNYLIDYSSNPPFISFASQSDSWASSLEWNRKVFWFFLPTSTAKIGEVRKLLNSQQYQTTRGTKLQKSHWFINNLCKTWDNG